MDESLYVFEQDPYVGLYPKSGGSGDKFFSNTVADEPVPPSSKKSFSTHTVRGCVNLATTFLLSESVGFVEGASIIITSTDELVFTGLTDGSGRFDVFLSPGDYTLEISKTGYETYMSSFTVGSCLDLAYQTEDEKQNFIDELISQARSLFSAEATNTQPLLPVRTTTGSTDTATSLEDDFEELESTNDSSGSVLFFKSPQAFSTFMFVLIFGIIGVLLYFRHKRKANKQFKARKVPSKSKEEAPELTGEEGRNI